MGQRRGVPARPMRLLGIASGGAVSLAYSACWAIAVLRDGDGPEGAVAALLYGAGEVLAVLAPPAWFALCLLLPRTGTERTLWLTIGLVALAPYPLLLGMP